MQQSFDFKVSKQTVHFNRKNGSKNGNIKHFSQELFYIETVHFSIRQSVLRLMPSRLAVRVWFIFSAS